ncbi:hypothetical protein [Nostoc sp.]|uniref:hypothetical protein n=1 Tax=Nostoc sp. TaxID=1180 RepID=UPI002FF199A7
MQRNLLYPAVHPGYVTGRYYQNSPLIYTDTNSVGVLTTNTITYVPFRIDRNINIDRIAISCAGVVTGGVARIGLYTNNNGFPSNLLLDTGDIAAASAGIKEAIVSLGVNADWYWFAGATSTPPNLYCCTAFAGSSYILGQTAPSSASPVVAIRQTGFTYGAFPSSAPISSLSLITGNIAPLIWFRVV